MKEIIGLEKNRERRIMENQGDDKYYKRRRNLIWGGIFGFAIIVIAILVMVLVQETDRLGKMRVEVHFAPFIAKVTAEALDGGNVGKIERLANDAEDWMAPGKYKIKAELDGFETLEKEVEVDEEGENIYGLMKPNSEKGEEIVKEHERDYKRTEWYAGEASRKIGAEKREKYPLLKELPINNALFQIGHEFLSPDYVVINIRSSDTYINLAVDKIKSLDTSRSLADYDIKVYGVDNPFVGKYVKNEEINLENALKVGFSGVEFQVEKTQVGGEYGYAILTTGSEQRYDLVKYRVVMKREGAGWTLVGEPQILLTTANTPGVPIETLNKANYLD